MRASEKTFRSLRRMHGLFLLSTLGLLVATVWMLSSDANRPWKAFQREYRQRYSPKTSGGIRQIVLPELTYDLNFRRVARCDRCTTCHLGIEQQQIDKNPPDIPQPFRSHPRLELFVGPTSPHPAAEFGCTICHEGQGSATDFHWASHTPNDSAAAQSWKAKYAWSQNSEWDFSMLPARFSESRCLQCHRNVTDLEPTARFPDPPAEKLVAGYHLVRRLGCFGCHELEEGTSDKNRAHWAGDTSRKMGPNLRQIAEKTSPEHLADRIADPLHFLPESPMPRLFGLIDHLDEPAIAQAKRFEAVEIRAITTYLLEASEPTTYADDSSSPSAERGRKLFEMQGCLACHKHQNFSQGQAIQGPNLSRMDAKYTAENARQWLVGWLRDPALLAPRTLMPNPRLEKSSQAEDIAAFLLASAGDFQNAALPPLVEKDLNELISLNNRQSSSREPTATARKGIELPNTTTPLNTSNAVANGSGPNEIFDTVEKKLQYFGKLSIARRGCFGCHDITGFEQSQGIGPALSNWGRKPTAQLAFEKINEYIAGQVGNLPKNTGNYEALHEHRREGFLWQKLREPRSYDYRVAAKKNFNEYLRMGRFNLTDSERESIMTFVLGLTADPPQGKYAYRPGANRMAIIEGRKVLDRFACAECHTLEMERLTFSYKPGEFPAAPQPVNFAFLLPQFSEKEIAASRKTNAKGFAQAEIRGMMRVDSAGKVLEDENDEGRPIFYYTLWKPAVIDGNVWNVGGPDVSVPLSQISKNRPARGGTLARLLYPAILADAKARNSNAPELDALGWLPPTLAEEGSKVQPPWLANYLLNPTTIRPASVMPMPKSNLSEEEAAVLAAYFAATSKRDTNSLPRPKTQDPISKTHDQSMRLLTDANNFCAKCHLIGDYRPDGVNSTNLAPNLADAGRRLQPQYIRRWLADPKSVLPYTPMPQNFPPQGDPRGQDLLPGSSLEQLDAIEQLLIGYDEYAKGKMSIRKMIPQLPQQPSGGL